MAVGDLFFFTFLYRDLLWLQGCGWWLVGWIWLSMVPKIRGSPKLFKKKKQKKQQEPHFHLGFPSKKIIYVSYMLFQKSPTFHVFNDDVVCNLNVFSCPSVHAMYRVKVGNDQEMAHSERNQSHSQNRSGIKLNWQSGTYTKRTYRKPNEQLFPNRRPLSYPNLTKYTKAHI